jgi:hypothetical protein
MAIGMLGVRMTILFMDIGLAGDKYGGLIFANSWGGNEKRFYLVDIQ